MDARSSPDITHSAPLHDGRAGTLFVLINLNNVGLPTPSRLDGVERGIGNPNEFVQAVH